MPKYDPPTPHPLPAHAQQELDLYCPLVSVGSYCVVEDMKLSRWACMRPCAHAPMRRLKAAAAVALRWLLPLPQHTHWQGSKQARRAPFLLSCGPSWHCTHAQVVHGRAPEGSQELPGAQQRGA